MVNRALSQTGLEALADRPVDALSGGQRQRAWIAMTLAQDSDIILLDEPTTFLDLAYQIEVLDLLHDLNLERHKTIVMVLHDLNQACRYAHHLVAMREGAIAAQGKPNDVVNQRLVCEVFGIECSIIPDPLSDTPLVIPIGRTAKRVQVARSASEASANANGHAPVSLDALVVERGQRC
jgi:iron complex transport system ATP-binding protein